MNKNKRLLFIIPGIGLGGSTTALASILNSSFSNKYDVDVFAISKHNVSIPPLTDFDVGFNDLTTAYYSDFSHLSLMNKIRFLWVKLFKQIPEFSDKLEDWVVRKTVKRIERKKQYDYIVAFQENIATRFAIRFSCENKIAWIHCDYAFAYGKTRNELDLYDKFLKIVCVSKFTKKGFLEKYPSLKNKTIAIHNIFDAENVKKKAEQSLTDGCFDPSLFTIISVGRVCDVKRFYLIPQIARQLTREHLVFKWYILGKADNPQELVKLSDAIKQYDMMDYVCYLGGKTNPYPYFTQADLLVSISMSEACPMIFNEAKILQLPILSSDFGSACEFIEEGKDGYIASLAEIPEKIIEMIRNPEKLTSIKNQERFCDTNNEILKQLYTLFT